MTIVRLDTTAGAISIELNTQAAPATSANFLTYCEENFYAGTLFHRVINNFMVQGGGLTPDMRNKPNSRAPIANEADNGLKNVKGSVAMARTGDPHSATNQFFINVADNAFLDHRAKTNDGWGYAVFGKVVEGMDVVDAIRKVGTTSAGGHQDVPREPIEILGCKILAQ